MKIIYSSDQMPFDKFAKEKRERLFNSEDYEFRGAKDLMNSPERTKEIEDVVNKINNFSFHNIYFSKRFDFKAKN